MKDHVNFYNHQYCTWKGIWVETPAGLEMTYTIAKQKLEKEFMMVIQQFSIISYTSGK